MSTKTTESKTAKVIKIVLKVFCLLLVFGTTAFFLWRVFSSGNPKSLERLTPNAALRDACLAADEAGETLTVRYQFQEDYITSVVNKNYGYFAVTDTKFIPDAKQVQVLFRYNNSTIRHLKEDYKLPELPDRDEELYDVTLYVLYDLTPDVESDNDGKTPEAVKAVRYHATSSEAGKKNLYNFRKLVFDGVEQTDEDLPLLAVYVDFYYVGDVDYEEEAYGALPLYLYTDIWDPYEPSKAEWEAIRNYSD